MSRLMSVYDLQIKTQTKPNGRGSVTATCIATTFVFQKDTRRSPREGGHENGSSDPQHSTLAAAATAGGADTGRDPRGDHAGLDGTTTADAAIRS